MLYPELTWSLLRHPDGQRGMSRVQCSDSEEVTINGSVRFNIPDKNFSVWSVVCIHEDELFEVTFGVDFDRYGSCRIISDDSEV